MPLSKQHKAKISAGVRKYHKRAKDCFADQKRRTAGGGCASAPTAAPVNRVATTTKKKKRKATRRVKPTQVAGLPGTSSASETMAQHSTAGQRTTERILSTLPKRMAQLRGKDAAPQLAF